MMKCEICGESTENLQDHLLERHYLNSWDYHKIVNSGKDIERPCGCGKTKRLASIPFGLYGPCDCGPDEFYDNLKKIQENLRDQPLLTGLFCLGNLYKVSESGYLPDMLEVLKNKYPGVTKEYIGITISPGYPKEISERNKDGVKVIKLNIQESPDFIVTIGSSVRLQILTPEVCGYDMRHHSRYSILNIKNNKNTRYTKRIRISDGTCYKFYNNKEYQDLKSIFKLIDPDTQEILEFRDIQEPLRCLIKQVIFRNPKTSEILWGIYNEVLRYSREIDDQVLLQNSISIPGNLKIRSGFVWSPLDVASGYNDNKVTISIL